MAPVMKMAMRPIGNTAPPTRFAMPGASLVKEGSESA